MARLLGARAPSDLGEPVREEPTRPRVPIRVALVAVAAAGIACAVALASGASGDDRGADVPARGPSGAGRAVPVASALPWPTASGAKSPGGSPDGQPGTGPPAAAGSPAPVGGLLVVDVVGQVRSPGVVRLPPGARVIDAVAAAGGATAQADLQALNLARKVGDGELILVPRPGQSLFGPGAGQPEAGAPLGDVGAGPSGGPTGAPLDLNTATAAGLDALPGIGPVLAGRIVAWRTAHGRFSSVDELSEVSGIGPALLGRLRPMVRV
jgi:competence protein ComEA